MANVTKMDVINSIQVLYKKGWSQRRIAETLEVNRRTVSRYIREAAGEAQNAPNPTAGSGGEPAPKCTKPDPRVSGPLSRCEAHRRHIEKGLDEGLSAKRIHQDLCVERGVAYVKDNALKSRKFSTLAEANTFLSDWEAQVADTRIHGTTRKQVGSHFRDAELPNLQALPDMPFPAFSEGERMVHRDGYVEVKRSYYQAPPEYVGRKVRVRWDARTVRIFNHRMEELRVHGRVEEGQFAATPGDRNPYECKRSCAYLIKRVEAMGPFCTQWAREQVHQRGAEAYRTLLGLLDLTRNHQAGTIEHACEQALGYGIHRLKELRELIAHPRDAQQELEFLREHPLIRGLDDYQAHLKKPQPKETPC